MSFKKNSVCPFEKQEIVCKICDGTDGAMESIFCEDSDNRLLKKIFKCTNVQVKPVCGIISPICEFCRFRIDQFDDTFQPQFKEYVVEKVTKFSTAPNDDPFNCLDLAVGQESETDDVAEESFVKVVEIKKEWKDPVVQEVPKLNLLKKDETNGEVLDEVSIVSCQELVKPEEDAAAEAKNELIEKLNVKKDEADRKPDDQDDDHGPDWDDPEFDRSEAMVKPKRKKGRPKIDLPLAMLKRPTKCEICGKLVTYMKDHMRMHSEQKRYKCPHCDRSFAQSNNLVYHVRKHTGEKPFACDKCDKSFICKSHLLSHKRSHVNDQPFQCEFCSKRFNQSCNLTKHLRVHSGEKPYKCRSCDKDFMNLSNMKAHEKRHRGERNFTCEICSKSFYDNHHLERHISTHSKEKQYKCSLCSKEFSTASGLKSHMAGHDKPVENVACAVCHKAFSCSKKLSTHMKVHNSKQQPTDRLYPCSGCSKVFKRPELLTQHERRIHEESITRKPPREIIIDPETATKQLERGLTKPYRCEVCSKVFNQAHNLKVHLRVHIPEEKQYKCDKCPRSFNQKEHLKTHDLTHTGFKPFACECCPEQFTRASTLKEHRIAYHGDCYIEPHEQLQEGESIVMALGNNTQLIELPSLLVPGTGEVMVKFEIQNV